MLVISHENTTIIAFGGWANGAGYCNQGWILPEIFQYDYEDYFAYSHFGKMSGYLNMTAAAIGMRILNSYGFKGEAVFTYVNGDSVPLAQGQGIVVNSRQLHGFSSDDPDCTYLCTLLHPMLLCASREVEQKYVAPLLTGARQLCGVGWGRGVGAGRYGRLVSNSFLEGQGRRPLKDSKPVLRNLAEPV